MDIKQYLNHRCQEVEQALDQLLPPIEGPLAGHVEAMRYSLLAGGKRIRPILCLAAAEALPTDSRPLLPVAAALECIHTYSLIHDDLPAMDDDDLRRGNPTCHKKFGEAAAILAGDGLLSFAFELLARPLATKNISAGEQLHLIGNIAAAIGPMGMVGGQVLDIEAEGRQIELEQLQQIHRCKTGALITVAVQSGAIGGGADRRQYEALTSYGEQIGLAFQIVDDLLNVTGDSTTLGKAAGSDAARGKATYPALLGLEATRRQADEAVAGAITALNGFGEEAEPLRELARYIAARRK
ncbi:polyprenyl synthetase family protein [Desulfurivibrio alkaliphilus]|uniref:Geranyltranstransferase n=1 Tax=Desulfurivibrio alkaliphilus (strain DSM 19089 / UNIQEM U267 / AHT2) TaxID=589865 RepID=D6Z2F5_DESAT|nr:farnesyl diphosphate synthase [Desulfurivibrio alkaliphilus]ADH85730.1 Geranyltranstransferase [Desulfurivibrio alkaliphilus AHT 2]